MVNGCLPQNHMTFLCRICNMNVNDNDHAIKFDMCNFWVNIKCNLLMDYKYLQRNNYP